MLGPPRGALLLLLGLAVGFFGTLALSTALFPKPYDWRYQVISSLASPKDNPHWYGVASFGLALTGVLLWPFATYLQAALGTTTPYLSRGAGWFHRAGCVCLVLTALISGKARWLAWHRVHEDWAELAGLFLGLAFAGWAYGLIRGDGLKTPIKFLLLLLTLFPLGGFLLSRIALFYAYRQFSPDDYQLFKHSLFCSLALWEWVGAVCLYLFLALAMLLLPRRSVTPDS